MKKRLALTAACLAGIVAFAGVAAAETTFAGKIAPGETVRIVAPFAATVEQTFPEAGDTVRAGDALLRLSTTKVYAPCDGTVRGVLVEEGDRLDGTALFYQGAMYLEPQAQFVLRSSTESVSVETENKILHVGETVYLRRNGDSDRRTGTGRIVDVSGKGFTVEILTGNLELNDSCYLYRSEAYDYDVRIGKGTVTRNDPVALNGTGVVLKLHAAEGQAVRKGDLLMETVPDLAWESGAELLSPADGIVAASYVTAGGAIGQYQLAMEIWPAGTLEARISVDEYDLARFETGRRYTFTLDCDPQRRYEAVVISVGSLPTEEGDKTCYEVELQFENDDFVRSGMNVTLLAEE